MSDLRLASWANSFKRKTQRTAATGSLEWDFSDGEESSPSPPNVSVTSQAPLWEGGQAGLGLLGGGADKKLLNSKPLSRSISFAMSDEVVVLESGPRLPDPAVYEDTLQPSKAWTPGGSLPPRRRYRSEAEGVFEDRPLGKTASLGRKPGVCVKTHLPIQHAIRFPGSNLEPPPLPPGMEIRRHRKISNSLPEGLNLSQTCLAPEAEVPGGGPDADIALPDAREQGEDRTMPTANGGLAKKRPESVASSKGDPEDISDLKRQFSHTSLVSIFSHSVREKLSNVLPSGLPKNSDLNKLRILVCILFAVCFGIVFATHVFHRRHKGQVRIFDQVRLEEHHRHLLLYDTDNRLVTQGHLGRLMPEALHPYPCKPEHTSSKEVKCLEWKYLARLEISPVAQAGASCHRLVWSSLSRDVTPRDCWPVGPGEGHWYGGGERMNTTWPLGSTATVTMSPFVTGDEAKTEWGNVIKKSWLNSRGLSITVDDETPLSISLNDPKVTHGHHGLCLQASFDEFPYYYHRVNLPVLNYTVCTAQDLGKVYSSHLTPSWEGQSDTDIQMLNRLLRLPLWQVPSLGAGETYSPAILDSYLSSLLGRNRAGRGERGYILLDSHWQQQMGDFTFAPSFTNSRKAQELVRETGLRLAITISPFVSVDSASFREGVMQGLFVMERNSTSPRGTPALTWFQDVPVAALLDITNNKTISWLRNKLRSLAQGDASEAVFFIDTGNTFHMPHYFSFNRTLSSPDLYKQHFIREAMEEVPVIGVSGASSARPKAPAFVSLSPLPPTWPSLQSIVPNILHLGVIGFPFINPGPIGGVPTNTSSLPEAELYKRWWQLATFLPQLHFLTPPKAYLEQGIATVSRSLKQIREKLVTPLLLNISREAVISGLPLVRPLWMLAPHDEVSQRISDQFLLGDTLLVAPVLREGQRARDVYLPPTQQGAGVWKSKDDTYHAGGQWLNNTEAPLDSVLYYQRLPEGSRPGDTLG